MINTILIVLALVALATTASLFFAWRAKAPSHRFLSFASAQLVKWWRFVGPRITDKGFQAAVIKCVAGAAGVVATDGDVQTFILVLTLTGTFLYAPWESLPFETLEGERPAPTVEIGADGVRVTAR